ncbi:glycosyltransferase [Acidipropionibacterium thoenii]|uniref:glycosyltransferase n=1 Tax=Acidipropionibacterium thoenii TaxID=1751 RepID=UPI0009FD0BE8|nr:glycosyltransferase [Acidipropionibacterium thoenii]
MRVLLVGAAPSIHMVRWANGLAERGHDVHLATAHRPGRHAFSRDVHLHLAPDLCAGRYLTDAWWLRRLADSVDPDIVNVHFATGYGLMARLAHIRQPTLLSVWGADIYDTPRRNAAAARIVRDNLAAATRLASTSLCMADVIRHYAGRRPISITPFGVDTDEFVPSPRPEDGVVRVGTVKALFAKYGIDDLIRAFAVVREQRADQGLELHLYGEGPDEGALRELASGLDQSVIFHGAVPHEEVPKALAGLDVFAALSTLDSESFGVAILEAGACGLPVVVTDTDGPAEVVEQGRTGLIVPRRDVGAAAAALERLVDSSDLRRRMGQAGRHHVLAHYSWKLSLELMEQAYRDTIQDASRSSERRGRHCGS